MEFQEKKDNVGPRDPASQPSPLPEPCLLDSLSYCCLPTLYSVWAPKVAADLGGLILDP